MDSILLQKHQELIGHLEGNLYRTSPIISSDWESEEENVSVKKRGRGRPKKDEFTPKKKINARTNEFNELDSDARDEEKDRKHHMLQSKREKRRCGSPDHKSLSATSSVEWTSMVPGSPDISSSMSSLPDSLPIMSSNSRSTPCFYQQCSLYLQDSGSLLLPSKFEGFPIRACKKHAEGWRLSTGLCEICHGMNSAEFEVPKQYTNSQDNAFHLCGSCAKRQRKVLNLHQEESVSDNDSQYGMSDPETISDRSPNTAVVQNETQPQKQSAKGPVKLDASGERYLDHFEKIEQWNRSNMNESEVNSTAFRWFATVGFEILQSKGKVTIPIEYRLPAKKGLANNFKGGNVDELFGRNPHEWGYVVQLEALDLVRAREDCWVTFKAGHEWNPYAFHDALIAWNKQLGEGWQPVLLPPPPPRVQEPQHIEPKEHIASPDTGYHKQRKEVKKKEKKEYEPVAITSKIEAMQMQAERIKPKLDEIPFGDVILSNNGTGDKKSLTTGRHGAVYKGMWKGYPVAVRFPLVKLPIAESDRNTFLKTVEKVSKATHPNLVANYACCASDQLCILSEFMNIGNLQDFLTGFSSEITEMYFAKIASDIARAMDHIHSKGILHCNLSSKNVMLKGEVIDGGIIAALEVKVADVGFNSSLETRLDSTDPYLAPEVLNSQMHTSFSDVYSFGKILCYLFSDRLEPLPVEDLKKNGVDSRWIEIIQQCLHTVPEQRPTFGQILNILTSMNQRNRS